MARDPLPVRSGLWASPRMLSEGAGPATSVPRALRSKVPTGCRLVHGDSQASGPTLKWDPLVLGQPGPQGGGDLGL